MLVDYASRGNQRAFAKPLTHLSASGQDGPAYCRGAMTRVLRTPCSKTPSEVAA